MISVQKSLRSAAILLVLIVPLLYACGGSPSAATPTPTPNPPGPNSPTGGTPAPQFTHVVLVLEENHSFSSVIGNGDMPYLNSLASKYGLAANYFANTHPSIGNYFMLTTGQIITNDDSYVAPVDADNLARRLIAAGKSWKSYAESLPSVGYLGGDTGLYLKRHNPFSYFTDVAPSTEASNVVPFSQFPADLAAGNLPEFAFVAPNIEDDAHDGTLAQADAWLKANIDPLLSNPAFQQTLLIIVFDEGNILDLQNGGGHVAAVIVSPKVKPEYQSSTMFQHQNTLRTIMDALGLANPPGAAATAQGMEEFFQ